VAPFPGISVACGSFLGFGRIDPFNIRAVSTADLLISQKHHTLRANWFDSSSLRIHHVWHRFTNWGPQPSDPWCRGLRG